MELWVRTKPCKHIKGRPFTLHHHLPFPSPFEWRILLYTFTLFIVALGLLPFSIRIELCWQASSSAEQHFSGRIRNLKYTKYIEEISKYLLKHLFTEVLIWASLCAWVGWHIISYILFPSKGSNLVHYCT